MRTPPRSVLIIATRRIGDALLATPLVRSVKRAWPQAAVDALVFAGTEGVLAANPDLRRTLTVRSRPGALEHAALFARLARRYDVALSTQHGDRATLYAFVAGRWRAGLLDAAPGERWKRALLQHWIPFDDRNTHTVRMNLALAGALGIAPRGEVAVCWSPGEAAAVERRLAPAAGAPLAVLHPYPKFNYKMWHSAGWSEVAAWLAARGQRVVLSGGPDAQEVAYVAGLAAAIPCAATHFAGQLSLGETGYLLSRARCYVGPDTVTTHMAASLGIPTVALYGPTDPVKWGPWPRGQDVNVNPWRRHGSQVAGHVAVVQGAEACVPCLLEGCERHVASTADCLLGLRASAVIAALERVLAAGPG
jgi:heptosyltransferase-3